MSELKNIPELSVIETAVPLLSHIEANIFPELMKNDKAHNVAHTIEVIERSFDFIHEMPEQDAGKIDPLMVLTVGAYHDVCVHVNRELHEKLGAQYLLHDSALRQFFSERKIGVMSQAVRDHRASMKREPASVYGRILSSADRPFDFDAFMRRMYVYYHQKHPEAPFQEICNDALAHITEKYGPDGYAVKHMYFQDKKWLAFREKTLSTITDPDIFAKEMARILHCA